MCLFCGTTKSPRQIDDHLICGLWEYTAPSSKQHYAEVKGQRRLCRSKRHEASFNTAELKSGVSAA